MMHWLEKMEEWQKCIHGGRDWDLYNPFISIFQRSSSVTAKREYQRMLHKCRSSVVLSAHSWTSGITGVAVLLSNFRLEC